MSDPSNSPDALVPGSPMAAAYELPRGLRPQLGSARGAGVHHAAERIPDSFRAHLGHERDLLQAGWPHGQVPAEGGAARQLALVDQIGPDHGPGPAHAGPAVDEHVPGGLAGRHGLMRVKGTGYRVQGSQTLWTLFPIP